MSLELIIVLTAVVAVGLVAWRIVRAVRQAVARKQLRAERAAAAAVKAQAEFQEASAPLRELLEKIRAGASEADAVLVEEKDRWETFTWKHQERDSVLRANFDTLMREAADREKHRLFSVEFLKLQAKRQQAQTTLEQIVALQRVVAAQDHPHSYVNEYKGEVAAELGFDAAAAKQELAQLVIRYYNELCMTTPISQEDWALLKVHIGNTRKSAEYAYWTEIPKLEYPADWDLWTSHHHKNPTLDDFSPQPDLRLGELGQRAGVALQPHTNTSEDRERRLVEVKILLAYANSSTTERTRLGGWLYGQLEILAAQLESARRTSAGSTQQ